MLFMQNFFKRLNHYFLFFLNLYNMQFKINKEIAKLIIKLSNLLLK